MNYCVHVRTGVYYKITAMARHCRNPAQRFVVYEQLSPSTLRPGKEALPAGTTWVRDREDFLRNFRICPRGSSD